MFRRRHKLPPARRLRELIWPRRGWRRAGRYLWHRLLRLPGTPYSIAAGFACGAALSFTPLLGLHSLIAMAVAWVIGGNVLAAFVGTSVGNPWTFPFIWLWTYKVGHWMGADGTNASGLPGGPEGTGSLDVAGMEALLFRLNEAALTFDVSGLGSAAWPVFVTMLVGGIPTAIVVWFLFYFGMKPLVVAYKNRRHRAA